MITQTELVETIKPLQGEVLVHWIELGWVLPHRENESFHFDPADVARVRLICELHYELQIEEESLSVVLSLMDQLYATRRALSGLMSAVQSQPDDVRARIATSLQLDFENS